MKVLVSWSSGKDSAWALHTLRGDGIDVVGLLTTLNEDAGRVSMQGVRRELLHAQADVVGLPVWEVPLPSPCPNEEYEHRMGATIKRAVDEGVTHIAFGDLFLQDVRQYREDKMAATGIRALFPIWCAENETAALAERMVASGMCAIITCVDPSQLDPSFAGQHWDPGALPTGVDQLGERGEFHTFCWAGPMFPQPIRIATAEVIQHDGFWWADLTPQ
ncbi:MAG TPA: ATP-binding protein [Acidimicrobiia bacterium]|nr:ATP-binding protein [Acidimicrobiia bacterium]